MHKFPRDDETLKNQTTLSSISDEDFRKAYSSPKFTKLDRIIQVFMFIICLGWARILVWLVAFFVYLVTMTPAHAFCHFRKYIQSIIGIPAYITRMFNRFTMYTFGVFYIHIKGKQDPNTRAFIYNHSSFIDGLLMFYLKPFTMVVTSGAKKIPFLGQICIAEDAKFIDRTKSQGNSHYIKEAMEDLSIWPTAIAPEGKITNGDILFKFRTGGFIADVPIQPVTFRYRCILPFGGGTLNWVSDTFQEFVWLALCVPFTWVEVEFLPVIMPSELTGLTPAEKAEKVQLIMANKIGTLAIDRSTREIFEARAAIASGTPEIDQNEPILEQDNVAEAVVVTSTDSQPESV